LQFAPDAIRWLSLLIGALLLTVFGTIFPNRLNQYRERRPHNVIRLINESLARSHLGLMNYFLAIAITGNFEGDGTWKITLVPIIIASVCAYLFAVAASIEQEKTINRLHGCTSTPCSKPLGTWNAVRLSFWYWAFWVPLFALAVAFAFVAA
jgi:hypothetical protein